MSTFNVIWSQSGLTDNITTVNYYEEGAISASVSAVYEESEIVLVGEVETTNILSTTPCFISLSTSLKNVTLNRLPEISGTITGTIRDIFTREIKYLIDNKDPKSRQYGVSTSLYDIPQKKLFLYSYQKEQIPEKEIAVTAIAYIKNLQNQLEQVGSMTYQVTVVNVQNDGAVIDALLEKHSAMEIE